MLLLQEGADINVQNNHTWPPLRIPLFQMANVSQICIRQAPARGFKRYWQDPSWPRWSLVA